MRGDQAFLLDFSLNWCKLCSPLGPVSELRLLRTLPEALSADLQVGKRILSPNQAVPAAPPSFLENRPPALVRGGGHVAVQWRSLGGMGKALPGESGLFFPPGAVVTLSLCLTLHFSFPHRGHDGSRLFFQLIFLSQNEMRVQASAQRRRRAQR